MKRLIGLVLLSLSIHCSAQFYESGEDPASIKWLQINTPRVKVIFPSGFDSAANRLANIFNYIYPYDTKTLNYYPKKFSVVLHNHSSYSNGFVTLAPRRMELYTTPPQSFTAQDWLSELAIHEFRHIVQVDKTKQGFTKGLYCLFGEQGNGVVAGLLPRWFLEGDAVYAETALSNSGRGRTGNFTMEIKSLLAENRGIFSFEKMLLGSYKNYIPDYYKSGYFLVSAIRKKYGADVFDKCLNYTAQNSFNPFSFGKEMKNQTGKNGRGQYKTIFRDMRKNLINENYNYSQYISWCRFYPNSYTSWNYPQYVNDQTLLTIKTGFDNIPQFIFLDKNGEEIPVFTPGNYMDTRFSYANNLLAWTEEIPDLRYGNRSYSCIKIVDTETGSMKKLTRKTRYFSAALSSDAAKVATVEITKENRSYLVILDTETKNKIHSRSAAPYNLMISDPVFSDNNKSIICIISGEAGKAIFRYDISSQNWEQLTQFYFYNLTNPVEWKNKILFSSDFSGTNNIYACDTASQNISQVTFSNKGAFEPCLKKNGSVLFFTEYSNKGYSIKTLSLTPQKWKTAEISRIYSDSLTISSANIEGFNFQDSVTLNPSLLSHQNPVKRYSRLTHMFNIHSWSPFYYDYMNIGGSNQYFYPGLTLISQNKLSTCISSLSYYYDNGYWKLKPQIVFKRWLPVFEFSYTKGGLVPYAKYQDKIAPREKGYESFNSSVYIPLNLSRGKNFAGFTPFMNLEYDNYRLFYTSDSSYHKGRTFASYGLNLYSYLRLSKRDIAPSYGFYLSGKFSHTPFDDVQYGWIGYVTPRVFLPGFFPHHSLQIAGAYQQQEVRNFLFSSQVEFARGYYDIEDYSEKLYAVWLDYHFPIAYPDWALGPVLYIKRFRANLFADYANNSYNSVTKDYTSCGVDMLFDMHIFRLVFPFSAGIRWVYQVQNDYSFSHIILKMDLIY